METALHEKWSDELMNKPPGGTRTISIVEDNCVYPVVKLSFRKFDHVLDGSIYTLSYYKAYFDLEPKAKILKEVYEIFEKCLIKQCSSNLKFGYEPEFSSFEEMNVAIDNIFKDLSKELN